MSIHVNGNELPMRDARTPKSGVLLLVWVSGWNTPLAVDLRSFSGTPRDEALCTRLVLKWLSAEGRYTEQELVVLDERMEDTIRSFALGE